MSHSAPQTLHSGWMAKKGNVRKSWRKRFFVLNSDKMVNYYEDDSLNNLRGTIDLSHVTRVATSPESNAARPYCIDIVTQDRTWVVAASSKDQEESWLRMIRDNIHGTAVHSGWLTKRGGVRKNWRRRFFEVRDTRQMKYYRNADRGHCLGTIDLKNVDRLEPGDDDAMGQRHTIVMITNKRVWFFSAEDRETQTRWINVLEQAIGGAKRLITTKEGYLTKIGKVRKSWKRRYFVLSRGWLFYFADHADCQKFKDIAFFSEKMFNQAFVKYVLGSISLEMSKVQKVGSYQDREHCFTIATPNRLYYIQGESETELDSWLHQIRTTMAAIFDEKTRIAATHTDREREVSMSVSCYSVDFPELDEDEPQTFKEQAAIYGDSFSEVADYMKRADNNMDSDDEADDDFQFQPQDPYATDPLERKDAS